MGYIWLRVRPCILILKFSFVKVKIYERVMGIGHDRINRHGMWHGRGLRGASSFLSEVNSIREFKVTMVV